MATPNMLTGQEQVGDIPPWGSAAQPPKQPWGSPSISALILAMRGMTLPLVLKQQQTLQIEQGCPAFSGVVLGWMPRCPHSESSVKGVAGGGGGSLQWGGAGAVTSEGLIQVFLAKDDVKVMHSACVELHAENHITGQAAKLLVVTLQLQKAVWTGHQGELPQLAKGGLGSPKAKGPLVAPHTGA